MTTTAQLGLLDLTEGGIAYQRVNDNLAKIDAVTQLSVKDRTLTAPPGSPTNGDRYYVAASATGAWSGHDGTIAIYLNTTWYFLTPKEGWAMWVDNEDITYIFDGTSWLDVGMAADPSPRILRSALSSSTANLQLTDGSAYFTYLGHIQRDLTLNYVRFGVKTAASGTQTAEIGLFSTPSAPNRSGQTLTKICSSASVDSLTSSGPKGNTSAFAQAIQAGTHLWAGLRTSFTVLTPIVFPLLADFNHGRTLISASAAALTGSGPWSGSVVTDAGAGVGIDLEATID